MCSASVAEGSPVQILGADLCTAHQAICGSIPHTKNREILAQMLVQGNLPHLNEQVKKEGRPGGVVVKFSCLASAAQGSWVEILGADLCTAHQATL